MPFRKRYSIKKRTFSRKRGFTSRRRAALQKKRFRRRRSRRRRRVVARIYRKPTAAVRYIKFVKAYRFSQSRVSSGSGGTLSSWQIFNLQQPWNVDLANTKVPGWDYVAGQYTQGMVMKSQVDWTVYKPETDMTGSDPSTYNPGAPPILCVSMLDDGGDAAAGDNQHTIDWGSLQEQFNINRRWTVFPANEMTPGIRRLRTTYLPKRWNNCKDLSDNSDLRFNRSSATSDEQTTTPVFTYNSTSGEHQGRRNAYAYFGWNTLDDTQHSNRPMCTARITYWVKFFAPGEDITQM